MVSHLTCADVTIDELSEELLARLDGRRHPFLGTLELTERCNLACIHCRASSLRGPYAGELTTD